MKIDAHQAFETQFGKITEAAFLPSSPFRNAHLQTLYPKLFLNQIEIDYVRERIKTPDDDFVELSWHHVSLPKGMVIIFHGLEGSDQSHYVKHLVKACAANNLSTVVMHFRGCGSEVNLQPISYHSGATFDPLFIIPMLKKQYPHLPLFATGFSLGGNMLIKLLAEHEDLPIEAAVCVSAPLNLEASSKSINMGFSKVYQWHLMKSMKRNMITKMSKIDMSSHLSITSEDIKALSTFRQFDDHITSKLHGFLDAQDYYKKCSALPLLQSIKFPTLVLHAKDDPFMNADVIPETNKISDHVAYELSQFGGHVGFTQDSLRGHSLWLPHRIISFVEEFL